MGCCSTSRSSLSQNFIRFPIIPHKRRLRSRTQAAVSAIFKRDLSLRGTLRRVARVLCQASTRHHHHHHQQHHSLNSVTKQKTLPRGFHGHHNHEDNAACIARCEAGLRHVRNAKHYVVRLRFLQQLVVDGEMQFQYCPTDLMVEDYLTKPLDAVKFSQFRSKTIS